MKITALVLGKEFIQRDRKDDLFKVTIIPIVCDVLPVLVGKEIVRFVDSAFYNSLVVDPTTAVDFDVDVRKAYKPEYATLHLDVEVLGFSAPEEVKPADENNKKGKEVK